MRALLLTHNYPRFDGDPVGSFVHRLAVLLAGQGIDVRVMAPAGPDLPAEGTLDGIRVSRFRYAPKRMETLAYTGTMASQVRGSWKAKLAMAAFLAQGYRAVARLLSQWPADVLHAQWWFPGGLIARAVHARTGLPYVVTMHGSDIRLAGTVPGGVSLFRRVGRSASALTTVSQWLKREAVRMDPEARPTVAPMPVAPDLFFPGQGGDPHRLLFVGKLTDQKGLHHLLRALPLMSRAATVDVVGAGRVDDTAIRRLAADLGVAHRINWLPMVSQRALADLYRSAAIHVIPAIHEGLGLTAVESLLCETPVVAFDSGGLPDIVVPEKTGLLVPAGDSRALAAAIDRVLADAALRKRLGRDGRRFALEQFGPEAAAQRYATILRDATGV